MCKCHISELQKYVEKHMQVHGWPLPSRFNAFNRMNSKKYRALGECSSFNTWTHSTRACVKKNVWSHNVTHAALSLYFHEPENIQLPFHGIMCTSGPVHPSWWLPSGGTENVPANVIAKTNGLINVKANVFLCVFVFLMGRHQMRIKIFPPTAAVPVGI